MAWKKTYHGAYEVSKGGMIRRCKPGISTHIGYVLSPYDNSGKLTVKLCWNSEILAISVDELVKRVYG